MSAFPGIPPFPSDVPTAPLLRISLAKLLQDDVDEEERLWNACRELGFFYIDLRAHEGLAGLENGRVNGTQLLRDAAELFEVQREFFEMSVEEKTEFDFSEVGSYHGYKGYGKGVLDKQGTTDRNEFYNTSKDSILALTPPLPAPALLTPHHPLLTSYITNSHALVTLLLSILSRRLGLPADALPNLHRLEACSGDQVRFIRAPPQPEGDRRLALGAHTDFGSVSVLFNRVGGLQVRLPRGVRAVPPSSVSSTSSASSSAPSSTSTSTSASADDADPSHKEKERDEAAEKETWAHVPPLPSHAIVNLGDALVKFTSGLLRSNTHRVAPPPGAQASTVRYSLVYFARPEDDVLLRRLRGSAVLDAWVGRMGVGKEGEEEEEEEEVTAKEWILRRAFARRTGGRWEDSKGTEEVGMRRDSASGGQGVGVGGA